MDNVTASIITSAITITANGLIALASSSGLFLLIKNVLPSYFNEKGKNLADKEDIAVITREIESVKNEFSSQTEQLRSDLQYFNQLRFSIKEEERKAIISCFEKYHVWLTLLINVSFGNYSSDTSNDITEINRDIELAYKQVLMAGAKMDLLAGHNEYTSQFDDLKLLTIELSSFVGKHLIAYHHHIRVYRTKVKYLPENSHDKELEALKELHEAQTLVTNEYSVGMLEHYKLISPKEAKWQVSSLKRLTDIESLVRNQ